MKEKLANYKNQVLETWSGFSQKQKIVIIAGLVFLIISVALLIFWVQQEDFVPIYTNLSPVEAGEIVETIESKGIAVQLSDDGTSISVPEKEASRLKVELAHAGVPKSGNINYSIFSENMGLGMTDRQFDVIERDAMQNELRYLIEEIDGVDQAQVMINLPAESVWLTDEQESASASVVIHTRPGLDLNQEHINGLYHLISKSVPNLPVENIVIMDHHWQPLELADETKTDQTLSLHQQQREVKRDIERDIQRDLQQMLGTMLGMDKVVVSVFANIDFSKENREEQLVEPVDEENNEGLVISAERIQESYAGEGTPAGGVAGTDEPDIAGYPGTAGGSDGEYEKMEERINHEVNRIHRQIESSPYQIKDLTINVGVEPPDPEDPASLPQQTIAEIENILRSVVLTSLSSTNTELTEDELADTIEEKINVFATTFQGKQEVIETEPGISNAVLFALAAALILAAGTTAYIFIRRRRVEEDEEEDESVYETADMQDLTFPEEQQDSTQKRLERLARENPKEFAKLLRSWMAED